MADVRHACSPWWERLCEDLVPYSNQRLPVPSGITDTAVLDVSRAAAEHLARLLHEHHVRVGPRRAPQARRTPTASPLRPPRHQQSHHYGQEWFRGSPERRCGRRGRAPPHLSFQPHDGQRPISTIRCVVHMPALDSFHHSCHTPPDNRRHEGQARLPYTSAQSRPAEDRAATVPAERAEAISRGPPSNADRCIPSTWRPGIPVAAYTVCRTDSSDGRPITGGRPSANAPRRHNPSRSATSAVGQIFSRAIRSTHEPNASPVAGAVTSADRRGIAPHQRVE